MNSAEERIQNHDSNYKRKFIQKVTEVEEVTYRRNGLRKQVTEAKEGPLESRRKREARKTRLGGGVGKGTGVLHKESLQVLSPKGF